MADPAGTASASTPWFTTTPGAGGMSITSQRAALNQAINGVAQDLTNQNASLLTAIQGVVNALTALASR